MVTAQWSGTGGIEMRVGDDQFLALVSTAVVPYDGTAVAIEAASRGIAPSPRTQEVDPRASQREVGMVVHTVALGSPERESIVAISTDVAVDNDGA